MELLNILLSSVLGLLSPVGLVLDETLEGQIAGYFQEVEELQVRIDNAPNYQILSGQVERVRIAGRGLWLPPLVEGAGKGRSLRIALLEVETDSIDVDLDRLDEGITALERPFQAGIRLVLEKEDFDRALQTAETEVFRFDMGDFIVIDPQIDFTDENRFQVRVGVQQKGNDEPLQVAIASGLRVRRGRYLEFLDPQISVNEEEATPELLDTVLGEARQVDLDRLTPPGILIRFLRWNLTPDRFEIALFVRVSPDAEIEAGAYIRGGNGE
ncbi:MAG: DUF2993 domain-containing protein [Cyanobacteriota bacterium]|nr:DUF2993 domain-containing protein [Cyanobacteriota bacterium]